MIGIGIAFLIRNVWPEIPVLDFLARNWPYILIVWGGLRLAELFFWSSTGKPLPVSGVSGGEWTLIVVLCLFGMSLFQFQRRDSWWAPSRIRVGGWEVFGDSFDFNYTPMSVKAPNKTPRIVLENFRGDAQITGTDSDEVKVAGRKSIRAMENADAERSDKNSPLEVIVQGDQVIVRCNQERADSRHRITSKLEIVAPRGASIDARGRVGDFDIRDINGMVEIYSENAGVRLDNLGGNVRIDTRRSDIIRAIHIKGNVETQGPGRRYRDGRHSWNGGGERRIRRHHAVPQPGEADSLRRPEYGFSNGARTRRNTIHDFEFDGDKCGRSDPGERQQSQGRAAFRFHEFRGDRSRPRRPDLASGKATAFEDRCIHETRRDRDRDTG